MELTLIEPNDAMNLNRFTLAFAGIDQPMENRFMTQYCLRNLRFLRICLYLSILAFGSLGFWDAVLFPSLKYSGTMKSSKSNRALLKRHRLWISPIHRPKR